MPFDALEYQTKKILNKNLLKQRSNLALKMYPNETQEEQNKEINVYNWCTIPGQIKVLKNLIPSHCLRNTS